MATTQFSLRLPEDLKNSLSEISKLAHRSQSQIAVRAITEYVERNEWKIKALQAAKQEADKGVFVSHDAIDTWLDSWGTDDEIPAPKPDVFLKKPS
jgi:predicted transcriptional regulator